MHKILVLSVLLSSLFSLNADAETTKQRIQSERFGDWHYRCVEQKTTKAKTTKRCEVVQIAQTKRDDKTINLLTISLSQVKNKKKKTNTVITVLTPLNVFLPSGLGLTVDKSKSSKLKYRNCNKAGCWIQHLVNVKLLKKLNAGNYGFAKMRLINGQNINVKFSLKGLSKAMAALKSGKSPKVKS